MTKTKKTLWLALVVAVVGGPMAMAQDVNPPVVGLNLQTNVAMNVAYQAKDDLFAGTEKFANGASDVTEINLDPNTMGMVGATHGPDAQLAKKMKMMSIHTYKYDKPGMYRQEDVDAYRKKLEDGSWHCSIHVRNKNGSTDICSRTGSDHETNEMVILTAEPQKLTFIHMSGNMSLDELDQMSGSANGLNHRIPHPAPVLPSPPTPSAPGAAPVAPAAPVPPR
jgi:Domain of unknown function (DUF4252)